jgi:Family of unknown function (DUF6491)
VGASEAGFVFATIVHDCFNGFTKMAIKQLLVLLLASILLGCASAPDGADSGSSESGSRRTDCIFGSSIRGYTVLDESNLIVDGSGRRKYHIVLRRRAYGLSSTWAIRFNSPTGRICADFSEVIFDDHFSNEAIRIEDIRELTPEDYEDLLIQFGKKEPEIEQTPVPREVKGAEVEELDPAANDDPSGN